MTTTDQLRTVLRDLEAKAKEMELDKKLTTFADQADQFLRVAATRAGDYAAENRERVEATLDKAGAKVDEKTEGKYHASFAKVRAGVLTGVDWVVEQRESSATPDAGTAAGDATSGAGGGGDTTAGAGEGGDATEDAGGGDAAAGARATASASSPAETWSDVTDAAPQDRESPQDTVIPQDTVTEGPTDPR
ncbi:MAG TPA: antitoxin [Ornithinibacter sp.]|nr:antitoxin [Ornithinibacter sp.]